MLSDTVINQSPPIGLNWIGGRASASRRARRFEQRNPANLDEVTAEYQLSSADDVNDAIGAAERAFKEWRRMPPLKRADLLNDALALLKSRRWEMAACITRENGKTLRESDAEIESSIREMEFQIAQGIRQVGQTIPLAQANACGMSFRYPLGVVAIITPWNFPLSVLVRKLIPALMAGNTVVTKPASLTPGATTLFTEWLYEAGLPSGVLNLVTGPGGEVGDTLVKDSRIRAISFTGSTEIGMHVQQQAAPDLKRTQLELGGKNALVVLDDADLDAAVSAAVLAGFTCAGQWCTSTSRIIVHKAVMGDFTERLVARVGDIRVGNGTDSASTMGPVCGKEQRKQILRYIDVATTEGARCLTGGHQIMDGEYASGCFIAPTVFAGVAPESTLAQEEVFGPVLALMEASDFDAAVGLANDVRFGLCSSIYTKDLQKAFAFIERTEVGFTHVNLPTAYRDPQLAFGGIKASGFGPPESGDSSMEFFTEHKVAYVSYT